MAAFGTEFSAIEGRETNMMRFLNAVFARIKAAWQLGDRTKSYTLAIDHHGRRYRVEAKWEYLLIAPDEGGEVQYFSTDEGEPHYKLARAAFDGFDWNFAVLRELIDICVQDRS